VTIAISLGKTSWTFTTEKEEPVAAHLIRQRVQDYAKAVSARDIDRVMSFFAPNMVSFDLEPPLQYTGADNKRRRWLEGFAAYGTIACEVHELNVTTHGELAFVHGLNHFKGTLASGHITDTWALDSVLPANRWRLAGCARSRVRPSGP
jgi:ketosteroid isomerase-like protein